MVLISALAMAKAPGTQRLAFLMDDELHAAVDEYLQKTGMTRSAAGRVLVRVGLSSPDAQNATLVKAVRREALFSATAALREKLETAISEVAQDFERDK